MIRGSMQFSGDSWVSGWVYSSDVSLRGRVVLAFLDGHCVGSGAVDVFRQDLLDAGLGDGFLGFSFQAGIPSEADAGRVYVKLEGSDLVMLQERSKVADNDEVAFTAARAKSDYSPESLDWMRARDWIDQTEFDFLRQVSTVGLSVRSLRSKGESVDPAVEAERLFTLYRQEAVMLDEQTMPTVSIGERRLELIADTAISLIGVWAPSGALHVLEGSQADQTGRAADSSAGAVRYTCRADSLLIVDARAQFTADGSDPARVFVAR